MTWMLLSYHSSLFNQPIPIHVSIALDDAQVPSTSRGHLNVVLSDIKRGADAAVLCSRNNCGRRQGDVKEGFKRCGRCRITVCEYLVGLGHVTFCVTWKTQPDKNVVALFFSLLKRICFTRILIGWEWAFAQSGLTISRRASPL